MMTLIRLKWALNIVIGVLLCGVGALAVIRWQQPPAPEQAAAVAPAPAPAIPTPAKPVLAVVPAQPKPQQQQVASSAPPVQKAEPQDAVAIDPKRLAEAETALVRNRMYEQKARTTLPTLSLQTHNPVWALEQEAEERKRRAEAGQAGEAPTPADASNPGPQAAPESGPFGNIQPPDGEIWLRIPVDNAKEFRDIMAQNADLYRAETGFDKPVTVTLWVGGRVYARQQFK
ncbi:hypothetical protein [Desulfobulbus elongatus]|uniref:hypothetical protein n=1 Tax=Desulfobulbus elongatus TaxID=53332 RepID=UPI000482F61D|nr:hypothetical protein [Desulfobulbus elongatus]